jgi:hypothetical protein
MGVCRGKKQIEVGHISVFVYRYNPVTQCTLCPLNLFFRLGDLFHGFLDANLGLLLFQGQQPNLLFQQSNVLVDL